MYHCKEIKVSACLIRPTNYWGQSRTTSISDQRSSYMRTMVVFTVLKNVS